MKLVIARLCKDLTLRSFGFAKDAKSQDDSAAGRRLGAKPQDDKRGEGDGLIGLWSAV